MTEPPEMFTPSDLAHRWGVSERKLRSLAREHGCCRIVGNRMRFTLADVEAFSTAIKPPSVTPLVPSALSAILERDQRELEALRKRMNRGQKGRGYGKR